VVRTWDTFIFCDKSTFSSAIEGPVFVYRLREEGYNCQYIFNCKRLCCVYVHSCGWIPREGAGMTHLIEGHLDGLLYKHILQNVMVTSVRMLYPDGLIHFQQGHSTIYDSHVVHEFLLLQAEVELIDWPRRAPDMNPIENA